LFEDIVEIRRKTYVIKKQIRALTSMASILDYDENELIHPDLIHLIVSLKSRLDALFKFAESVNKFADDLLNAYNSKIMNETNVVVTRLTSVTIMMGL
jgi:Mg2+ and Co2+ transporter CorA